MIWSLVLGLGCLGGLGDGLGDGKSDDDRGDDTGATADDSGGGGGDTPTLRWLSFSGTCGGGDLTFNDVPAGPVAVWFTYEVEGAWSANPGGGMSSALDEATGVLTVPCGSGNDIPPGREVRVSLGYPALELPSGDDLKARVLTTVCDAAEKTMAEDVSMDFLSLGFTYVQQSDGSAALNPPMGMSTTVSDGVATVPCGGGNSVASGDTVHLTTLSESGGDKLDWQTFVGTCGGADLTFDADPGAVAVSFQQVYKGTTTLSVNTGGGMSAMLGADGEVFVPCGDGNDISPGAEVRIALGYAR